MSILDDGRPLVVATERDRIGQGPWARLFATSIVGEEGSSAAERGRALARAGSVHTVAVAEGLLSATVEEDETEYSAEIAAEPVPPRIWAAVSRSARGNAQVEAAVAGRAQSVQLEHVLTVDWEEPLVPAARSLRRSCTCGLPACAHVAALGYALADRLDREPSLLLRWRGCTERAEPAEPPAAEAEEPIVTSDEIWEAGSLPLLGPCRPLPTAAVLKRLGRSGIQVGAQDLADVLERAYASFASTERRD